MAFFHQVIPHDADARGLAMLALAIVLGLALGAIRVKGVRLGVSGVLFAGLLFGQLGMTMDAMALQFLRDFALIIFMYAIGLQVGPAFIESFKAEGLRLNLLAAAVVILGAILTAAVILLAHLSRNSASGLYAGAFTTTPGLAAGQEALRNKLGEHNQAAAIATTGLAYAVSYPLGLIGPLLVIVFLKRIFRIRMADELAALSAVEEQRRPKLDVADLEVTQPAFVDVALKDLSLLRQKGILFTRLLRGDAVTVPGGNTIIQLGDVFRAVGARNALADLTAAIGRPSARDLGAIQGDVQRAEMMVTRTAVLRKTLHELDIHRKTGVTIARINRAGVDLAPRANLTLHFGDGITAVGPREGLKIVAAELGNSPDELNRPQLIPIFLGVVLGVIVGSIPLVVPGLSFTVRIGLAGGPMIAAIALAQLGNVGSVVWYMPAAASQLFRDFGLAVFLACVGFQSGGNFLEKLAHGGFVFVFWGALITIVPVLLIGCFARLFLKMNFVTLAGWVAGAMTSTPGLLFANDITQSNTPAVAYAAVAPLAMLIPVICAQLLVYAFI